MAAFTQEAMRARFAEACGERDAIMERAKPLREARDKLRQQMAPLEAQERQLNAQIKQTEEGLFDLHNEIGSLVRALNGRTSAPAPAAETASPNDESGEGAN